MATETNNTQRGIEHDIGEEKNKKKSVWMRGFHMLVFVFLFSIGQSLLAIIALFQFLSLAITGDANERLSDFGATLAIWLADVAAFLTCVTDDKPFPWDGWPSS